MVRHKEFDPDTAVADAMDLFWRRGYEATSVQDLVEHTGVGRRSMYDTFGDKHSLYLRALDRYLTLAEDGFREKAAADGLSAIRSLFSLLLESPADDFRGCLFVNSSTGMRFLFALLAAHVDGSKSDPAEVAKVTLDAVANGDAEVLFDELTRNVKAGLSAAL
ncbi:TetR/AcrR family transcriptional regulator [Kutzneria sp. 744]|uniref:TetR/AcrR family transcriptional regulator n=1 Tax=Kutzneria sp. (strain 744) TaxID=345341 RepID=UPI0003EEAF4E|nr:TetR/AcrR family transcriptional regulator [Kutzneria sp. 744]EWM18325.1 transcriptional regulator, TetR family [Kutzneria sp. 744]